MLCFLPDSGMDDHILIMGSPLSAVFAPPKFLKHFKDIWCCTNPFLSSPKPIYFIFSSRLLLNFHSNTWVWINILQGATQPGIILPWLGAEKQPEPPRTGRLCGCRWPMNRKNTWETVKKVCLTALSHLRVPTGRNALFLQLQSFELSNILPSCPNNGSMVIVINAFHISFFMMQM